ncbi:hypothetical protein KCP71_07635 [Salmonella enterica subsp. enterica]|nr:hypothetical protein KCP71_07635 [Salmonella enterica subsp. enterica]
MRAYMDGCVLFALIVWQGIGGNLVGENSVGGAAGENMISTVSLFWKHILSFALLIWRAISHRYAHFVDGTSWILRSFVLYQYVDGGEAALPHMVSPTSRWHGMVYLRSQRYRDHRGRKNLFAVGERVRRRFLLTSALHAVWWW